MISASVLSTRSIEAGVYQTREDPRCRVHKDAHETVDHITAGGKILAGRPHMEHHNQVTGSPKVKIGYTA